MRVGLTLLMIYVETLGKHRVKNPAKATFVFLFDKLGVVGGGGWPMGTKRGGKMGEIGENGGNWGKVGKTRARSCAIV